MVADSNRTSDSTGIPTSVDDGTPAGHPTPAGGPSSLRSSIPTDAPAGALQPGDGLTANAALLEAIGGLIVAWGHLERTTAEKVAVMRQSFGDVRMVGGRNRPTMQRLLAELRALAAMRDRHEKQALAEIAEMDGALQRTAQFRQLIIDGAQDASAETLTCRDIKNNPLSVPVADILKETAQIDRICGLIAAL